MPSVLHEAASAAATFSEACCVGCLVVSAEGQILFEKAFENVRCDFCRHLSEQTGKHQNCGQVHLYGSYQAERFGGAYIYFCPVGMTYFASPLTADGRLIGGIVGGPLLLVDKEDYITGDILARHGLPKGEYAAYEELLRHFAQTTPERTRHLSDMLEFLARAVSRTFDEARADAAEKNRQQGEIALTLQELTRQKHPPRYPLETENELLAALSAGDRREASRLLNEVLGHIYFSSGHRLEIIRARVLELLVLLSRAAIAGGADSREVFFLNDRYLSEVESFRSLEELSLWLSRVMDRYIRFVFDMREIKHKDMMFKAVDYMKRNYMKKISLEEVASQVYLSPSYFSKVFKEDMGCTFSGYLNRLRIDKSKFLLLAPEKENILEIGALVGFEDQSYFTKVFKKQTGVTPMVYRELRGVLPNKKEGEGA